MKPKIISLEQSLLKEMFDYQDGNLVWKSVHPKCNYLLGKVAGCVHKSGYRVIKINDKIYTAHRLIWVYFHGSINDMLQIDHIDGNKLNNNIDNLRLVTAEVNCLNRSKHNAKGYSWNKHTKKWQASIMTNGKLKYLGLFVDEEEARSVYLEAFKQKEMARCIK